MLQHVRPDIYRTVCDSAIYVVYECICMHVHLHVDDVTRVHLLDGPVDYINANYVNVSITCIYIYV